MKPNRLLSAVQAALDDNGRLANWAMRGPWRLHYILGDDVWQLNGTSDPYGILRLRNDGLNEGTVRHIAHNDPTAVLRRVEADQRIVDWFAALYVNPNRMTDVATHLTYNVLREVVETLARGLVIDPRGD